MDGLYKICLVGDGMVGKSSIISRFKNDKFSENTKITIGVDFANKELALQDGSTVTIQLWDTAGQERFRAIASASYRGARGVVIVFSIISRESFNSITYWINDCRKWTDVPIILVGNKCDMEDAREVPKEEAIKKAQELQCSYIETSAKESTNIIECFEILLTHIRKTEGKTVQNTEEPKKENLPIINDPIPKNDTIQLNENNKPVTKNSNCPC